MCHDNLGETGPANGECPACGEPTVDGTTKDRCGYSSVICEECGRAPCDERC